MIIWKLTIKEQDNDPIGLIASSYRSPIRELRSEYYTTYEKADKVKQELEEAAKALYGVMHRVSWTISEIIVNE